MQLQNKHYITQSINFNTNISANEITTEQQSPVPSVSKDTMKAIDSNVTCPIAKQFPQVHCNETANLLGNINVNQLPPKMNLENQDSQSSSPIIENYRVVPTNSYKFNLQLHNSSNTDVQNGNDVNTQGAGSSLPTNVANMNQSRKIELGPSKLP